MTTVVLLRPFGERHVTREKLLLAGLTLLVACAHCPGAPPRFNVVETGIPELQQALAEGRVTSRQLVLKYLARIGVHQSRLNAAASVNSRALEEADVLARERAQGRVAGRCTASRSR